MNIYSLSHLSHDIMETRIMSFAACPTQSLQCTLQ